MLGALFTKGSDRVAQGGRDRRGWEIAVALFEC